MLNLPAVVWTTAAAAVLIAAGANAFNDAIDVEADRINRPGRPIPGGHVSRSQALVVWGLTTVGGLLVAWSVGPGHLLLAAVMAVLFVIYSMRLQNVALVGNVLVACGVALTLVFGALTPGVIDGVLVGALFAFLTTLARELVKDVQDAAGDRVVGSRALPAVVGTKAVVVIAGVITALAIALIPVPYLVLEFSGLYLLIGIVAAVALAMAVVDLSSLTRNKALKEESVLLSRASGLLKLSMVFGLCALIAARAPV